VTAGRARDCADNGIGGLPGLRIENTVRCRQLPPWRPCGCGIAPPRPPHSS
jgi:hypothetical protein